MAKRSKFQAALLLRAAPPSAFDVLREFSARLQGLDAYPPGLIPAIGNVLSSVIEEVDSVRAEKAFDKEQAKQLAVVESPGLTA